MNENSVNFELREPITPEAAVPDSGLELWMIFALIGVIALVALVLLVVRRKRAALENPEAIRSNAYKLACVELEKTASLDARNTAVQASLVLRNYLATAAADPALFETHEEFIARHDSLNALTETARQAAEIGFARLAQLKYAAELPSLAATEVRDESRALLEILHHGFAA